MRFSLVNKFELVERLSLHVDWRLQIMSVLYDVLLYR